MLLAGTKSLVESSEAMCRQSSFGRCGVAPGLSPRFLPKHHKDLRDTEGKDSINHFGPEKSCSSVVQSFVGSTQLSSCCTQNSEQGELPGTSNFVRSFARLSIIWSLSEELAWFSLVIGTVVNVHADSTVLFD